MREILFRGKKTDTKEWVEGYVFKAEWYHDDSLVTALITIDAKLFPMNEIVSYEVVYPQSVGQFTGKYDKNGKKIFEGDIVRAMMDYGPAGMLEAVTSIYWHDDCGWQWNYFDLDTVEVIGNIYDNPELLRGDL